MTAPEPPPETIIEWRDRMGYVNAWEAGGDRVVALIDTVTGGGQIVAGTRLGVTDRWTYPTMTEAVEAVVGWLGAGFRDEPMGWTRHQPSNRRRTYQGVAYPLQGYPGQFTEETKP